MRELQRPHDRLIADKSFIELPFAGIISLIMPRKNTRSEVRTIPKAVEVAEGRIRVFPTHTLAPLFALHQLLNNHRTVTTIKKSNSPNM